MEQMTQLKQARLAALGREARLVANDESLPAFAKVSRLAQLAAEIDIVASCSTGSCKKAGV